MNILLVDTSVQDFSILVNSCNVNTVGITYSSDTTREELLACLQPYLNNIKRIGLAFHYSPHYTFLENEDIFNENNTNFLIDLIKVNNIEHVDFLACNTLQDNEWRLFYENIIDQTNIILGASDNETGNIKYGGDWIMENTNEDIQNVYFNNNIVYYSYLLMSSSNFTCVLSSNNVVYGVGNNDAGQFGYQHLTTRNTLTEMINVTGKTPSKISNGYNYSLVLMTDGTIYGTGFNTMGQLGLGNYESQSSLAQMINTTGKTPSDIYAGRVVLMTDGTIYEIKNAVLSLVPNNTGKTISKISASSNTNNNPALCSLFALMTDGTIFGYGKNFFGQLGINSTVDSFEFVEMINTTGKTPSIVACGGFHTIVLMTDGTIYGTGSNSNGQLGNGTTTSRTTLGLMTNSTGKTPINVFCGAFHTLVLMSDNTIYGCGINGNGLLGYGGTGNRSTLTEMTSLTNLSKIPSQVCCGRNNTIILMSDNTIYACGSNNIGQLGNGTNLQSSVLVQMINSTGKTPSALNTGITFDHFTVLMSDGTIYGIGQNSNGELGADYSTFTELPNSTGKTLYQFDYGAGHAIALMTDGTIYGSGLNISGQLGLNDTTNRNNFTLISNSTGKIPSKIACGDSYTITLMSDGTMYGTGDNSSGQLGLNDNTNRNNLTLINNSTGKTPYQIVCGISHTIILMTDGTIYGTGNNSSGQLGLNDNINRNNLTLMINSTGKIPYQIACGDSYTVILMTDGTIYGTGNNGVGQLGLNDNINRNNLTLMINSTGKIPYQIACGNGHTIILMTDGTIYGTGENGLYQLGINDGVSRNNLTLFNNSTGKTPNKIICGNSNTMIFMSDNTVYSIGFNRYRQLGVGTSQNVTTLTQSLFPINFSLKLTPYLNNFSIPSKTFGDSPFDITDPSSNSSGSFSYSSSNTSVATISGKTINIVGAGTTTILATQAEDINYYSESIITTFSVNSLIISPTISNFSIPSKTFGDSPFDITDPSSNSSGSFSYTSSDTSVATISGKTITIIGIGNTIITATQEADSNFYSDFTTTTLTVNKASPTLSNFSNLTKNYGESPFTITPPSSNSSGSFSYISSDTSVADICGNIVTIIGLGSTTITATQEETSNYSSKSINATLTVNKLSPSLSNFSIPIKTFGDSSFNIIDPSSNSSGSFSYTSSDTSVATISGNTITIVGAGTITITANQEETSNYSSESINATLTVNKASPTLSNFSNLTKNYGESPFTITPPSSNSSGSFSYTSSDTSVATISGNTITIVGAGTITITANQEETSNYSSESINATLTVNNTSPSLSNFSIPIKTFGDSSFNIIDPSSNSSGSFSYTSSDTSVATISGNTITIVGAGTITITANQEETSNYSSESINATLTVNNTSPSLSNFSIPIKTFGDSSFNIIDPSSNSSGSFSYTSSDTSVATISGNTITIVGAGTITITATQEETSNYSSESINATLTVNKASPSLSNFSIPIKTFGDSSFNIIDPSSNSSGSFTYTSSDTLVATISGNTITIVGTGTATITATQEETSNYSSESINATLTVNKAIPSLSNFSIPIKSYGDTSFNIIDPSSNSTGSFSYTSSNTSIADISGNIITIIGSGTCIITASQEATNNYNSNTITTPFQVKQSKPVISIEPRISSLLVNIEPDNSGIPILGYKYSVNNGNLLEASSNTSPILISGLANKINYSIEVYSYSSLGLSEKSNTVKCIPGSPTAPTIDYIVPNVSDNTFAVYFTEPTLTNDSPIGKTAYTFNNGTKLTTVFSARNPLIIRSIIRSRYYNVQIGLINGNGMSPLSNTVSSIINGPPPRLIISNVVLFFESETSCYAKVFIRPPADGGSPIIKYKYEIGIGNVYTGEYTDIIGTSLPLIIPNLPVNISFNIKLIVTNELGGDSVPSLPSKSLRYGLGVPATPRIRTVIPSFNSLLINFPIPKSNGSSIITYKYSLNNDDYIDINSNILPFSVPIENNTAYTVKVKAVNIIGDSDPSPSSKVVSFLYLPPMPPTIKSIIGSNESLIVNFTPPKIRGAPITTYSYSIDSGTIVDTDTNSSPLTLTGLTNGTKYSVTLYANSLAGMSSASRILFGTPILAAPARPVISSIIPLNNSCSVNIGSFLINGSPITTFLYSIDGGITLIDANSSSGPLLITGLTNGTTYSITIIAVNAMGNSPLSLPKTVVPIYSIPSAPVITRLTGGIKRITVSLRQSIPNGSPIIAYYYSFDNGITLVPADYTIGKSSFVITNLITSTYTVTIYSENELGYSPASNTLSVFVR